MRTSGESGVRARAEWDAIAALGFDAVWLMGVWERSPAGIAIANPTPGPAGRFPAGAARLSPRRQRGIALLRAALRGGPAPGRSRGSRGGAPATRASEACGWCSISCRTMWRPITHGWRSTPTISFRERRRCSNDPASFLSSREVFACGRDPYLPRLAGRAATECLSPRSPPGGDRNHHRTSPASATASAATWRCSC